MAAGTFNLKRFFVAKAAALQEASRILSPRGEGAQASIPILGDTIGYAADLDARVHEARTVTTNGVVKRLPAHMKVATVDIGPALDASTGGELSPSTIRASILAQHGEAARAAILHRDGPEPIVVVMLEPEDQQFRARRAFDPLWRETSVKVGVSGSAVSQAGDVGEKVSRGRIREGSNESEEEISISVKIVNDEESSPEISKSYSLDDCASNSKPIQHGRMHDHFRVTAHAGDRIAPESDIPSPAINHVNLLSHSESFTRIDNSLDQANQSPDRAASPGPSKQRDLLAVERRNEGGSELVVGRDSCQDRFEQSIEICVARGGHFQHAQAIKQRGGQVADLIASGQPRDTADISLRLETRVLVGSGGLRFEHRKQGIPEPTVIRTGRGFLQFIDLHQGVGTTGPSYRHDRMRRFRCRPTAVEATQRCAGVARRIDSPQPQPEMEGNPGDEAGLAGSRRADQQGRPERGVLTSDQVGQKPVDRNLSVRKFEDEPRAHGCEIRHGDQRERLADDVLITAGNGFAAVTPGLLDRRNDEDVAFGHFRRWGNGIRQLWHGVDGRRLLAPARLAFFEELSLDLLPSAPLPRRRAVCDGSCQDLPNGYERVDECHVAGEGIIGAAGQGGRSGDGAARLLGERQKRVRERVVPSCLQRDSEIGRAGNVRIGTLPSDASDSEARLRLGQRCNPLPEVENRFALQPQGLGQARCSSAIIAGAGQQHRDIGQRPRHRLIVLHGPHVEEPDQSGSSGYPSTVTPQTGFRRGRPDPGGDQRLGIRGEGGDLEGEFGASRNHAQILSEAGAQAARKHRLEQATCRLGVDLQGRGCRRVRPRSQAERASRLTRIMTAAA